jgi:predicted permease
VLFPAILAETIIKADLTAVKLGPFVFTLLATMLSMACLTLALWPIIKNILGTNRKQFSTIYQTSTRWHGFIALAIILKLYGDTGAALIGVAFAVMVPILQISNIIVLVAFSNDARLDWRQIVRSLVINPIMWGVLAGLSINLLHVPVWSPIMSILDLLGRGALGLSLLALGAGLSLQAALKPSRELLLGLTNKLFISPAIMAAWAIWFGVSGLAFAVLLVCAAVPTAMNGYLLAKKMGGDAELYAATSTLQTVVSFFSIPLVLWCAERYAGGF